MYINLLYFRGFVSSQENGPVTSVVPPKYCPPESHKYKSDSFKIELFAFGL